jgi:DNA-binding NtrC family response regulator
MRSKSILVIDDDQNIRHTLAAILFQVGFRVITAATSCQAIEHLAKSHFDLVILDLNLPDIDGLTLLSNLHMRYPTLPIMILTGIPATNSAQMAERLGVVGYFMKPVDPDLLMKCIWSRFL